MKYLPSDKYALKYTSALFINLFIIWNNETTQKNPMYCIRILANPWLIVAPLLKTRHGKTVALLCSAAPSTVKNSLIATISYVICDQQAEDAFFSWPWHFFVAQSLPTRKEFVAAYVNHVFNTSVQDVFQEFERGFFQVCDRELVDLFQPEELQEFLVGKDVYDWNKLKQVNSNHTKSNPVYLNVQSHEMPPYLIFIFILLGHTL